MVIARHDENTGFRCGHCGARILPLTNGSYRNHCPCCLWSKHVDDTPGDRSSRCHGLMEPIRSRLHSAKGIQLVHRCTRCGAVRVNRLATDTEQPDSIDALVRLPGT